MDYLESTMESLVCDILVCWKWLGTTTKCYNFSAILTCSAMDENIISHNFQGIHHSIMNSWKLYLYSVIRY